MSDAEPLSRSELRAELAELELRLSRLFADRASMVALETRIGKLEERSFGNQAVSSYKFWLVTAVGALLLAIGSLILQFLRL